MDNNRLWEGTWSSSFYPSNVANGTVYVRLPHELKNLNEVETTLIIRYNGTYRNGTELNIPVKLNDKENGIKGVGCAGNIYFSMKSFGVQNITFAVTSVSNDSISGTYLSNTPADLGAFQLVPSTLTEIPQLTSSNCIIL
jgi:hypothetical protein